MSRAGAWAAAALLAVLAAPPALASPAGDATGDSAEDAAAALFDRIAGQPPRLRVFLQAMPKGGDLHNHLWGQPYAEQFLAWGGERGLCASRARLAIVPGPCKAPVTEPLKDLGRRDDRLWTAMIESLSTRGRDQGLGVNDTTGHDDFFGTFDRFHASAALVAGPMLASARTSAAANAVSYLELMENPAAVQQAGALALARPWNPDDFSAAHAALSPALPALIQAAVAETDAKELAALRELGCDTRKGFAPCMVEVRYQAFALRQLPAPFVFGQLAAAFALVEKDPRYVGINIVAPEDGPVAMADFALHMRMFRFLRERHPGVKLSLHAGELELGLVPPQGLNHHIRDSIDIAGASRIGHGVAIPYETDAPGLLAHMAKERIAVEINLTSNATILGVKGARHPLSLYRAAGVPVVFSTDDEGVSRSDMTNEYLRAATEQGLRYRDLKAAARASIAYSFLPGDGLGESGMPDSPCAGVPAGSVPPEGACATLLAASEKARAQWRLEGEFAAFEKRIVTLAF